MSKKGKLVATLLATLALLIAATYFHWTKGVYVRITNNTQSALKQVDIVYSGGVTHIAQLAPGTSRGRYVNPRWVSDLVVEWFDSSGVKHSRNIGVYIEINYAGSVQITVEPGNRVSVTDKVKLTVISKEREGRTYLLQGDANDVR